MFQGRRKMKKVRGALRALKAQVLLEGSGDTPPGSHQQVLFARLVTSCQQAWNKLLTTCNNLVERLLQLLSLLKGCSNKAVTVMI